jgi:hypothetical protein
MLFTDRRSTPGITECRQNQSTVTHHSQIGSSLMDYSAAAAERLAASSFPTPTTSSL